MSSEYYDSISLFFSIIEDIVAVLTHGGIVHFLYDLNFTTYKDSFIGKKSPIHDLNEYFKYYVTILCCYRGRIIYNLPLIKN